MSRTFYESRIKPSVLDRLIDEEPGVSHDPEEQRPPDLRQLKQAVIRDLERLLNTRRAVTGVPADLKEVNNSLAVYGLPDFTTYSSKNPADLKRMGRAIEDAISTFEPRLENVVVTVEPVSEIERAMHFRVDASLRVKPVPVPVTFDTSLQLGSGWYVVQDR
ncbi:MAG: type VI secretion system baseplate subunit TssE [Acidobacteria bacterium]|nr:type VI secretion system baseplate subunit TssE [Acidobacteriota bacterium]